MGEGAGSKEVASLENILSRGDNPCEIEILVELSIQYYDIDNVRASEYVERAFRLASKSNDSLLYVKTARLKGQLLRRIGRV